LSSLVLRSQLILRQEFVGVVREDVTESRREGGDASYEPEAQLWLVYQTYQTRTYIFINLPQLLSFLEKSLCNFLVSQQIGV